MHIKCVEPASDTKKKKKKKQPPREAVRVLDHHELLVIGLVLLLYTSLICISARVQKC